MAHIALFFCTTGCFSVFPSTSNNTGVHFRLGRSFQGLAVLTAVHQTPAAACGHIGLSCDVCLYRGKEEGQMTCDAPSKAEVML